MRHINGNTVTPCVATPWGRQVSKQIGEEMEVLEKELRIVQERTTSPRVVRTDFCQHAWSKFDRYKECPLYKVTGF